MKTIKFFMALVFVAVVMPIAIAAESTTKTKVVGTTCEFTDYLSSSILTANCDGNEFEVKLIGVEELDAKFGQKGKAQAKEMGLGKREFLWQEDRGRGAIGDYMFMDTDNKVCLVVDMNKLQNKKGQVLAIAYRGRCEHVAYGDDLSINEFVLGNKYAIFRWEHNDMNVIEKKTFRDFIKKPKTTVKKK